jgi:hypothetical protein
MRSIFPGYFRLPDREIRKLWSAALFVLDANVLLNFYRYSDTTRRDFVSLLKKLKPRLWLPNQACKEFLRNRIVTISEQEREYDDALSDIAKIEGKFNNDRKHPFLPADLQRKLSKVLEEVRLHLGREKDRFNGLVSVDPVLDEIEQLFEGNIGAVLSPEALFEIYKSGVERYKKRIPPGFKDGMKTEDAGEERKYGDLVLWTEMLERAKSDKVGVIFVTDDRKEDWWLMSGSKTIGPRPELVSEFVAATGQQILFYQPYRFLEYAKPFLGEAVPAAAIAETKARKEDVPASVSQTLPPSAWFDKVAELDRRLAMLTRELSAAERDLQVHHEVAQLVGSDRAVADLKVAEANVVLKKQQLAAAQAELKAITARP